MHLRTGVAIQPNLELKTWPKQPLGSLPLVMALPAAINRMRLIHPVNSYALGRKNAANFVE
jgi:hypothetical protein